MLSTDSRILKIPEERLQIRAGNFNSVVKSGMVTLQYVARATAVVTNTQTCLIDATFCCQLSLNVGNKFPEVTYVA